MVTGVNLQLMAEQNKANTDMDNVFLWGPRYEHPG